EAAVSNIPHGMLFERTHMQYSDAALYPRQSMGEFLTGLVLPLKQGIVLFWAVWLSITVFANICDGLKALELMGEGWKFASGNYALMRETTRKYSLPAWFVGLLFLGVVLWQGLSALLFWYAFSAFHGLHFPGLRALH